MGTPGPDSSRRWWDAPSRRFAVTFAIVGVVGFVLELLVMQILPVLDGVVDADWAAMLDALSVGLLVAPAAAIVAVSRHGKRDGASRESGAGTRGAWAAVVVVVVGAAASAVAAWGAEAQAARRDQEHFAALKDRLGRELTERLGRYTYGLHGARGVWPASEAVTRAEFDAMTATHDLRGVYPGATGMGFIRRVPRAGLAPFLDATRADLEPDFAVWGDGGRPELDLIEYFSACGGGRAPLGEDVGADPVRREAAERAMRTGGLALTGPLPVADGDGPATGYWAMLAVYAPGLPTATEADRRSALDGWVFMPIVLSRALADATTIVGREVEFEIFDADPADGRAALFDADGEQVGGSPELAHRRSHCETGVLEVGGRDWNVVYSATPSFVRASRVGVAALGWGGLLVTLAAAGMVLTLSGTAARARVIADAATRELRATAAEHEKLALVVRETRNVVVITDRSRRIVWVNPAFERLTGYTLPEVLGANPGRILQSDRTDPATVRRLRAALDAGRSCREEILNRGKAGNEYWLDVEIQPINRDPSTGEPGGFIAVETDITERKLAEARAREAGERTELALQGGSLGLWDWEVPTGRVVFDERWANMVGERPEDLTARIEEWSSRVHPDDLPLAQSAIDQHFRGELAEYRCVLRLRHRDGSWRWVLSSGRVVSRAEDGAPRRMVGTHLDVTEERRAQESLRRRERTLANTARLARVGWWEYELATQTLEWSDEVRRIHEVPEGYAPEVASAIAFYAEEAREPLARAIQECIEHQKPYDLELPFITAKGRRLWVRSLGEPRLVDGRVVGLAGAFQDISDQVAARASSEAANRAKSEFLANMSHEIRTPMTAILGFADLLSEDGEWSLSPERRREMITTIRRNGEHLLSIINDILDLSKIEAGKMTVEAVPTDPAAVLEDVLSLMRVRSSGKGLSLDVRYETRVPTSFGCDPVRLKQILVNLVGNAIKFTEKGGVTVRVRFDPAGSLAFAVQDSGIGMTPEQSDNLFHAFGQADGTMTRRFGGTGLGLTISKRLAEALGGGVAFTSEPGVGSTFTATVAVRGAADLHDPAALAEEPDRRERAPRAASPTLAGVRVLLAEDGPDNQKLIGYHLRRAGASVTVVDNGRRALEAEAAETFDVVLMDMQMPEMDGYTAARALTRRGCRAPIIALTAHAMAGDREKCLDAGCRDYATKPIEKAALLATVAAWADRARAPR